MLYLFIFLFFLIFIGSAPLYSINPDAHGGSGFWTCVESCIFLFLAIGRRNLTSYTGVEIPTAYFYANCESILQKHCCMWNLLIPARSIAWRCLSLIGFLLASRSQQWVPKGIASFSFSFFVCNFSLALFLVFLLVIFR